MPREFSNDYDDGRKMIEKEKEREKERKRKRERERWWKSLVERRGP